MVPFLLIKNSNLYCMIPHLLLLLFCEENASSGKTTYVHCKAGRGRSTTIVICYLVGHPSILNHSIIGLLVYFYQGYYFLTCVPIYPIGEIQGNDTRVCIWVHSVHKAAGLTCFGSVEGALSISIPIAAVALLPQLLIHIFWTAGCEGVLQFQNGKEGKRKQRNCEAKKLRKRGWERGVVIVRWWVGGGGNRVRSGWVWWASKHRWWCFMRGCVARAEFGLQGPVCKPSCIGKDLMLMA